MIFSTFILTIILTCVQGNAESLNDKRNLTQNCEILRCITKFQFLKRGNHYNYHSKTTIPPSNKIEGLPAYPTSENKLTSQRARSYATLKRQVSALFMKRTHNKHYLWY